MTKSAFSGHCERFEESRGNLKTSLLDFGNSPESGNPAFSLWTPALGSRKAGSLAGVTSSVFVFRNRYYLKELK